MPVGGVYVYKNRNKLTMESCNDQFNQMMVEEEKMGPQEATFEISQNGVVVGTVAMETYSLSVVDVDETISEAVLSVVTDLNELRGDGIPWGGQCVDEDGSEVLWDGWLLVDPALGNFSELVKEELEDVLPGYTIEIQSNE